MSTRTTRSATDLITEADFQATMLELARYYGWRVHAERPAFSRGKWSTPIQGDPGFPNLVLVRYNTSKHRHQILFLELKRAKGKLTRDQMLWLADLEGLATTNPDVHVACLRPSDIDEIKELLA